jgi:hypothetical protein
LFWLRKNYFVILNNPNKNDIDTLKNILNSHPKKASTPSIMQDSSRILVYLKCKDTFDLTDTLKKITDSVPNTTTFPLADSGYVSTPAKEQWKKSALLAFYIFLGAFFGGSTISGYLEHLDYRSPTFVNELLPILVKTFFISIPPTIVAFASKKLEYV